MTRRGMTAAAAAMALMTISAAWAGAGAVLPAHAAAASAGRMLQVRYEVRREASYVPPAPTEASRLEVLDPVAATVVEEGVLSAQSAQALHSLEAEEAAQTAAALAAIREQDARPVYDAAKDGAEPASIS